MLVVPARYEQDVRNHRPTTVQVIIDGDNANTASTVMGYAQAIVGEISTAILLEAGRATGARATLTLEPRIWYNPQLRSTLFLVPGLIAFIAMVTAVVSTALSVVREKERGTMEQIRMSPIDPVSFVLGKTLPYLALSFVSALLILFTARILFDLPMRGSWLLLCGSILLFLVGAQAQGLLISSIASSQQVAFQVALLSSFLPDLHPVGLHLSAVEHADDHPVDQPHRPGALLPRGAARHRLEGRGRRGVLGTARLAGGVFNRGARPRGPEPSA